MLQVENTNHCNHRCTYCLTHSEGSSLEAPQGHMAMDRFRAILDRHPEAGLLVLQGDGEPLLDPTLFDKLALARARGLAVQVITNGSLLDPAMAERLARDGPDLLLVSVDAVSPERNMSLRRGMRYPQVMDGVRAVVQARARTRRFMAIGLLSIVHGPFDAEAESALLSFNGLGIDILFYKQLNPAYEGRIRGYRTAQAGVVPAATRKALRYPVHHQRLATVRPCAYLRYGFPYYLWDGRRTPCCVLNDPSYCGPEFTREALLARLERGDAPAECERCSFYAGAGKGQAG